MPRSPYSLPGDGNICRKLLYYREHYWSLSLVFDTSEFVLEFISQIVHCGRLASRFPQFPTLLWICSNVPHIIRNLTIVHQHLLWLRTPSDAYTYSGVGVSHTLLPVTSSDLLGGLLGDLVTGSFMIILRWIALLVSWIRQLASYTFRNPNLPHSYDTELPFPSFHFWDTLEDVLRKLWCIHCLLHRNVPRKCSVIFCVMRVIVCTVRQMLSRWSNHGL